MAEEPHGEDFYDRAVEYFTAHPEAIAGAWIDGGRYVKDCCFSELFAGLSPGRAVEPFPWQEDKYCGCPAMVKGGYDAWTAELTAAVRDLPLPSAPEADRREAETFTAADLPAFAAAQRLADRMLGRTPPTVPEVAP